MKSLPFTLIMAGAILFSGCLAQRINVRGLDSSALNMQSGSYTVLGQAEGSHSAFRFAWLFPVTPDLDYEKAVNQAIAEKSGDNLIEVYSWIERQYWVIGIIDILHVKGTVIRYDLDVKKSKDKK